MTSNQSQHWRYLLIYTFFGTLAAAVNVVVFSFLRFWYWHYLLANTMAWGVSMIFSFWVNRRWVFPSNFINSWKRIVVEFITFLSFRLASFIVDATLMFGFITLLHWPGLEAKILDQVLIGLLNYGTTRYTFLKERHQWQQRVRQLHQRLRMRR